MTREIAGTGFRFNLIVNDNDGKLREGYLAAAPGMGTGEGPLPREGECSAGVGEAGLAVSRDA